MLTASQPRFKPQKVSGPRFRTGLRTMTGPTTGGAGLTHIVNYLKMADGGQVQGAPWQQFVQGSSNYLGQQPSQSGSVPPWLQSSLGQSGGSGASTNYMPSTANQQPGMPNTANPSTPQSPYSAQPAQVSWASKQQDDMQQPAWYQALSSTGGPNGLNAQAPPAAADPNAPGVAQPPASPIAPIGYQPPAAAPQDMGADRAAAAVQPAANTPVTPAAQSDPVPAPSSMSAPAAPMASPQAPAMPTPAPATPQQQAAPSPAQPASSYSTPDDYSPPAPSPPPSQSSGPAAWAPAPQPSPDAQSYPGAYGYMNQTTGQQQPNYTMDSSGSVSNAFPGMDQFALANQAALPQTAISDAAQNYPGARGYTDPGTGQTMGNYSMGPTGDIVRNFASGGQVRGLGQIAAMGMGPDNNLAHISNAEIRLLDQLHGGTEINPNTGLPQYGWLGNLLKGLVRAGAAIAGGMIAGPAGAAIGSGLGTKLTGGSWSDALKGAALSGIGGELTQGIGGGGWDPTKAFGGANPAGMTGGMGDPIGDTIAGGAASNPGLGAQFMTAARSAPGIAAGLGSLSTPIGAAAAPIANATQSGPQFSVRPMMRTQTPFKGDYKHYGEGPMQQWYDTVNPAPQFTAPGAPGGVDYSGLQGFADGGPATADYDTPEERGRIENQLLGSIYDMRKKMADTGQEPRGMRDAYRLLARLHGDEFGLSKRDDALPLDAQYGKDLPKLQANYNDFRTKHGMSAIPFGEQRPWWKEQVPQMFYQMGSGNQMLDPLNEAFVNSAARQFGPAGYASGGPTGLSGPTSSALDQAVRMGYMAAAQGGRAHEGAVAGPGGGTDDLIPAKLSNGEHVVTAREVSALGNGSNDEGQKRMYQIRKQILHKAGYKNPNPKGMPKTIKGLGNLQITPRMA